VSRHDLQGRVPAARGRGCAGVPRAARTPCSARGGAPVLGFFEEVITTNTIALPSDRVFPQLTILSMANLLREAIWRIHDESCVSARTPYFCLPACSSLPALDRARCRDAEASDGVLMTLLVSVCGGVVCLKCAVSCVLWLRCRATLGRCHGDRFRGGLTSQGWTHRVTQGQERSPTQSCIVP